MDELNLLGQLFLRTSAEAAWKEFLRRYSNLFLKVIWQFEKDRDRVMDTYLYVCKRFANDDFAILRKFKAQYGSTTPKFTTWLGAVVRNMCIDFYRLEHGRRRYPRAILRLPEFDRKVFELRFWRGHSVEEIEQQLGARRKGAVGQSLRRVERHITRAPIGAHVQNQPVIVPYDDSSAAADLSLEQDAEFVQIIDQWLGALEPRVRLIVRLKFWENMTAREIARILQIKGEQKVYTILQQALKELKSRALKGL